MLDQVRKYTLPRRIAIGCISTMRTYYTNPRPSSLYELPVTLTLPLVCIPRMIGRNVANAGEDL